MACNNLKGAHCKSAQETYNNAAQTIAATPTILNILGVLTTDTGCSIDTNPGNFAISGSGLYRISADVTITPTAAGVAIVQLGQDNDVLREAVTQQTVAAGSVYTMHAETVRFIPVCCSGRPIITVQAGGVAGTVSHVAANAVKLA